MQAKAVIRGVVAISAMPLLLGGCGAVGQIEADDFQLGDVEGTRAFAEARGYTDVVTMLEDGVVTPEEYASAHENLRRCKEDLGMSFGPAVLDPIGGVQLMETEEYRGPGNAPDSAAMDACDLRYFFTIEVIYTTSTPHKMDPTLLAAVHECLDKVDHSYSGNEASLKDFYPEGETWVVGDPVYTCVSEQAQRLFPDLPTYAITRGP